MRRSNLDTPLLKRYSRGFYIVAGEYHGVSPEILKIESVEFYFSIPDVGMDGNGFNLVYEPSSTTERKLFDITIHTDTGITGEYVGGNSPGAAQINTFAD